MSNQANTNAAEAAFVAAQKAEQNAAAAEKKRREMETAGYAALNKHAAEKLTPEEKADYYERSLNLNPEQREQRYSLERKIFRADYPRKMREHARLNAAIAAHPLPPRFAHLYRGGAASTAAAETSWNNALELAGKAAAANANNRSLPSKTVVTMSQQNINAKAAANARVAEAKKIYEENQYARQQAAARLQRNANAMKYNVGATNLSLGCTPCEQQIVAKLDVLLDKSKPTLVAAFNSANKTVQSALEATAVGLNKISTEGKVGLGVAAAATLAGAVRVGRAASTGVAAAAAAATAAGTGVSEVTVTAIRAAGSELERAAKIARRCVKGNATGSNRSVKCAAAYAAVQEAMDKLKALIPAGLVIPWPSGFKFPVSNYFTLKNNKGMTKFNRNVSNARGVLGRFGTRVSAGLGAFGSRVGTAARTIRNVAGKGASAVSRAMYRLSGREQADMTKQLLLDSQALKDQGKLTGQAVAQLQAAMAAAQPGVVTPAVAAAAAAVASPDPSNGLVTAAAKEEAAPVAAAPTSVGGRKRSRKNRSRKNRSRKGSRKNRKNRKSSRKH
jgi:hypothetical protein